MQSVIFGHSALLPTSPEGGKVEAKGQTPQTATSDFQKLLAGKLPHIPAAASLGNQGQALSQQGIVNKKALSSPKAHGGQKAIGNPLSDGESLQQFVSGKAAAGINQNKAQGKRVVQIGGKNDSRAEAEAKILANRSSLFLNKDQLKNRQQMVKTIADSKRALSPTISDQHRMQKSAQISNGLLKKTRGHGQYSESLPQDNMIKFPTLKQEAMKATQVATPQNLAAKDFSSPMINSDFDLAKIDTQNSMVLNPTLEGQIQNSQDAPKVFNTADLEGAKSLDEVIAKISDYVRYTSSKGQKRMEFSFKHQDLGKIDLAIKNSGAKGMEIAIEAAGARAQEFFKENQDGILKSLNQTGLKIVDVKIEGPASKGNFDSLDMQQGQNKEQSFSQQNKEQKESERRRELWDYAQQQREAA